jgi:hypothetical protein
VSWSAPLKIYSKWKLTAIWVIAGYICSALGIIFSVIYWSIAEPTWKLDAIGQVMGCVLMVPFGWLFLAIIPFGYYLTVASWVSIGCYIWSIKTGTLKPLYVSCIACFVFGLFWPKAFWAMMSV